MRAEYIPDDTDDIMQTVLRLKDRVGPDGVIFSSGGIGPTHDDVTYAAIAAAFGMPRDACTISINAAHRSGGVNGMMNGMMDCKLHGQSVIIVNQLTLIADSRSLRQ